MPASNTETKLPTFSAGQSLIDQLTETVMRSLVERIKQGTPVSGKGISVVQTAAGTIINLDNQRPPIGMYENPYTVGTLVYASSTSGGGGAYGSLKNFGGTDSLTAWGGSGDIDGTPATASASEIWHRDRPPLSSTDATTQGVKISVPTRFIKDDYKNTHALYERIWTLDSRGNLVQVGVETLAAGVPTIQPPVRQPFEVYLSGMMDGSSPKVFVAWGTVCQTNPSLNTAFPITVESLDKLWTFNTGEYIWLEVEFYATGTILSLKMKCGVPSAEGWTSFPNSYASGTTTGGNKWYHPIAHYRVGRTSKSTVNALPGNPFPDSGEEPEANATYTIAQLTNTHLVALQVCEYINGVSQQMLWKLTPGPGAVTGTGS